MRSITTFSISNRWLGYSRIWIGVCVCTNEFLTGIKLLIQRICQLKYSHVSFGFAAFAINLCIFPFSRIQSKNKKKSKMGVDIEPISPGNGKLNEKTQTKYLFKQNKNQKIQINFNGGH